MQAQDEIQSMFQSNEPQIQITLEQLALLQQQIILNSLLWQSKILNQNQQTTHIQQKQLPQQSQRKPTKSKKEYATGHWTSEEHALYTKFLSSHQQVMESPELKKSNKIFKLMAEVIGTRSPSQCRSHHQKFNPYTPQQQQVRRRLKLDRM